VGKRGRGVREGILPQSPHISTQIYDPEIPLLYSNETGGLIGMNIIWSHFIVRYTIEDSFIIGVACDKKWGGSEARKPRSLKSAGVAQA